MLLEDESGCIISFAQISNPQVLTPPHMLGPDFLVLANLTSIHLLLVWGLLASLGWLQAHASTRAFAPAIPSVCSALSFPSFRSSKGHLPREGFPATLFKIIDFPHYFPSPFPCFIFLYWPHCSLTYYIF